MAAKGGRGGSYYLQLSQWPIVFDRVSTGRGGVFFDPYNKHLLCVQNNSTDVSVQGLAPQDNFMLTIPSKGGPVKSLKFSGGKEKVLSIQRRSNTVEFVTVFSSTLTELSLPRKPGKSESAEILDFFWVLQNEMIVIVRKGGVDSYSFDIKKKDFKLSKSLLINIGWCLFSHQDEILLIRAKDSNLFQMFNFRRTSGPPLQRIAKFEVEIPTQSNAARSLLMACDVVMMKLYGVVYVAVRNTVQSRATEIVLYQPAPDGSAKPAHCLSVAFSPPITMSVVDNLVIVHHQVSKTSMVYDIGLEKAGQGGPMQHKPLLCPLPIAPCFVPPTQSRSGGRSPVAQQQQGKPQPPTPVDLYAVSWLIFQPDTVIDIQLGLIWQLKLNLEAVKAMMIDKLMLTRFLLNRREGQKPLLSICREGLESDTQLPFEVLSAIFNIICMESHSSLAEGAVDMSRQMRQFSITPSDLYYDVFIPYYHEHSKEGSMKVLITALSEFIRALHKNGIKANNYIYELLISLLIETKNFYQLQQFIQYRVVEDSPDVACLLVSKELVYPPAAQLALDMYRRQPNTENDIIDIMFSKGEIIQALRLVRSLGRENTVSARQFLEAAANEGDKMLFYTVYKFFEERNIRLRNQPFFPVDEQCQPFEDLYKEWFPDS